QCCYGADPATGHLVERGSAVGVLAAQALAGRADRLAGPSSWEGGTSAGLDRLEELLECRSPARPATLAPVAGVVRRDRGRVWDPPAGRAGGAGGGSGAARGRGGRAVARPRGRPGGRGGGAEGRAGGPPPAPGTLGRRGGRDLPARRAVRGLSGTRPGNRG